MAFRLHTFARGMGGLPRVVLISADPVESRLLSEWLAQDHDAVPALALEAGLHHAQTRPPNLVVADARFAFDEALLSICRAGAGAPLVVIGDPDRAAEALAERRKAFYVRRPIDREMLLCSVAMALADGPPVRRSPRKAVARFEAQVQGTAAALIDVSDEGLRLEVPPGRQSVLTPYFTMRVPDFGLTVVVQRIWLAAPRHLPSPAHTWCGAALAGNAASEERKWRKFVDLLPRSV
jgi:hypothetical protein